MKKVFILVLVLSLSIQEFYAQRRKGLVTKPIESTGSVILAAGVGYCAGDAWASPLSKSIIDGCNYDFEIGFRQMFSRGIGYRVVFQRSNYAADDGNGKHHGVGLYRSMSNLNELTARIEQEYKFGPKYRVYKRNSVYAFLGGGIIQGKVSYPHEAYIGFPDFKAGVISFGMGYTYDINEKLFVGTEFTTQYALSDKVDGYPLIVNKNKPVYNDALGNFTITFGYRIF